jgi:hypothetical protein
MCDTSVNAHTHEYVNVCVCMFVCSCDGCTCKSLVFKNRELEVHHADTCGACVYAHTREYVYA